MAVPTRLFNLIDDTPRDAIFIMRLLSALLLIPLPYLAFRLTRALGGGTIASVTAAFLPAGLPQLTHIGGAVNNDALIIPLAAVLVVEAVELAKFGATMKRAIWFGITYAAALWTKGMALPLVVLVIGAYVLAARREGLRQVVKPLVATAAISCIGFSWWIANVIRFDTLQPQGYPAAWLAQLAARERDLQRVVQRVLRLDDEVVLARRGLARDEPTAMGLRHREHRLVGAHRYRVRPQPRQPRAVRAGPTRLDRGHGLDLPAVARAVRRPLDAGRFARALPVHRRHRDGRRDRSRSSPRTASRPDAGLLAAVRPPPAVPPVPVGNAGARGGAGESRVPLAPLVPLAVVFVAFYGLARGLHHFYVGSSWSARLHVMSTWSPLRVREIAVIAAVGGHRCGCRGLRFVGGAVSRPRPR